MYNEILEHLSSIIEGREVWEGYVESVDSEVNQ